MRLLRTLLASPLLWGLVALGFFLIGLCPWAFPGEGADFMARTLGLLPASNAHPLAGLFYGAFGACLPAGAAVAAMNAASAVFGALCVALLCALVRGLLYFFGDEPRTVPYTPWAVAVAVPVAALACLLSPDFVRASTHFQWQTFDLFLLLAAAFLVLRTAANGSAARMGVAAFLIGLIALEAPELALATPVLLVALALSFFFAHTRLHAKAYGYALALPFVVGLALGCTVIVAGGSSLQGALVGHGVRLAVAVGDFLKDGPWILMALFGIVPGVLAPFVVGAVGVNRRTLSTVVTLLALTALSVIAFLPIDVSVAGLAREWGEAYPLLPAVCAALGLGAACGSLVLFAAVRTPFEGVVERSFARRLSRLQGFVTLPVALVLFLVGGVWSLCAARAADAAYLSSDPARDLPAAYADAVLDRAGDGWLLTDGAHDALIALRTAERGHGPTLLHAGDTDALLAAFDAAPFIRDADREDLRLWLRDFGFLAFLQAWFDRDPKGVQDNLSTLTLTFLAASQDPSKANFAQRLVNGSLLPDGPVCRLAADAQARRAALRAPESVAESIPLLEGDALPETAAPALVDFAQDLRRRLAANAVNAAFARFTAGEADPAKALLAKVHAFDPDNLSALVFLHDVAVRFDDTALRDRCEADLVALYNRFREEKRRLSFEEVLITQGNLPIQPMLQAVVVQYARNIRAADAVEALRRIAESVRAQSATLLQNPGQLLAANLLAAANDPSRRAEAIAAFDAILRNADAALARLDDPEAPAPEAAPGAPAPTREELVAAKLDALRALARLHLQEGDVNALRDAVLQGEALGGPDAFAYERALLHAVTGEAEQANAALNRYLDAHRDDLEAITFFATLQIGAGDIQAVRAETLPRLKVAVEAKAKDAGRAVADPRDQYFLHIVTAQVGLAEGNLKAARDAFLDALKTRPDVEAVRNSILELDLRIDDRVAAGVHAEAFLSYDPTLPFANYAMGSNALLDNRPEDAVVYLRRAAVRDPRMPYAPAAYNDLAEAYRRLGRWDDAIAAAEEAAVLSPALAIAYETAATAYLGKGDLEGAQRAIDRAFAVFQENAPGQPVDPRFILTRAKLCAAQGKPDEAKLNLLELRPRYNDLDPAARAEYDALAKDLDLF